MQRGKVSEPPYHPFGLVPRSNDDAYTPRALRSYHRHPGDTQEPSRRKEPENRENTFTEQSGIHSLSAQKTLFVARISDPPGGLRLATAPLELQDNLAGV